MSETLAKAKIVFVLGGPGSGKGTQCDSIVSEFGFKHISVGDLLRAEMAITGSPQGEIIANYVKEGKIVPGPVTINLLKSKIEKELETNAKCPGFLIDGFPREMQQAADFEKIIGECEFVLFFECSEQELEKRLLKRGETSGRSDDNIESIKKRFKTFQDISMPVIQYYESKNKAVKINSDRSKEEVYTDVQMLFYDKFGLMSDSRSLKGSKSITNESIPENIDSKESNSTPATNTEITTIVTTVTDENNTINSNSNATTASEGKNQRNSTGGGRNGGNATSTTTTTTLTNRSSTKSTKTTKKGHPSLAPKSVMGPSESLLSVNLNGSALIDYLKSIAEVINHNVRQQTMAKNFYDTEVDQQQQDITNLKTLVEELKAEKEENTKKLLDIGNRIDDNTLASQNNQMKLEKQLNAVTSRLIATENDNNESKKKLEEQEQEFEKEKEQHQHQQEEQSKEQEEIQREKEELQQRLRQQQLLQQQQQQMQEGNNTSADKFLVANNVLDRLTDLENSKIQNGIVLRRLEETVNNQAKELDKLTKELKTLVEKTKNQENADNNANAAAEAALDDEREEQIKQLQQQQQLQQLQLMGISQSLQGLQGSLAGIESDISFGAAKVDKIGTDVDEIRRITDELVTNKFEVNKEMSRISTEVVEMKNQMISNSRSKSKAKGRQSPTEPTPPPVAVAVVSNENNDNNIDYTVYTAELTKLQEELEEIKKQITPILSFPKEYNASKEHQLEHHDSNQNQQVSLTIKPRIIFVLGGPGSGKGTQCDSLKSDYGLKHISVGDLLRAEVASSSKEGEMISKFIKEGKIVPGEVTINLLKKAIAEEMKITNGAIPGFLIDGFPREMQQAIDFTNNISECEFVLFFECGEAVMEERLLKRGETSGRSDDNIESIKKRFKTFQETSMPVIDYFEKMKEGNNNKVERVNAERSCEAVYKDVQQIMAKHRFNLLKFNAVAGGGPSTHIQVGNSGTDTIANQIQKFNEDIKAQIELLVDKSIEQHGLSIKELGDSLLQIMIQLEGQNSILLQQHSELSQFQDKMGDSVDKLSKKYSYLDENLQETQNLIQAQQKGVDNAITTANSANRAASDATLAANEAKGKANEALITANLAKGSANEANQAANFAKGTANQANQAASAAKGSADAASMAANAANGIANAANMAANMAKGAANAANFAANAATAALSAAPSSSASSTTQAQIQPQIQPQLNHRNQRHPHDDDYFDNEDSRLNIKEKMELLTKLVEDVNNCKKSLSSLERTKANDDEIKALLMEKGDGHILAQKVSRGYVETLVDKTKSGLESMINEFNIPTMKDQLIRLVHTVGIHSDDIDQINDLLKKIQTRQIQALTNNHTEKEINSAVTRFPLEHHLHCLSCDRYLETVQAVTSSPSIPSGPVFHAAGTSNKSVKNQMRVNTHRHMIEAEIRLKEKQFFRPTADMLRKYTNPDTVSSPTSNAPPSLPELSPRNMELTPRAPIFPRKVVTDDVTTV